MTKTIIGIAGQAGSGKDTVSNLIANEFGYTHISTSDILRMFIFSCGLKTNRKLQLSVANNLRSNFGSDFFIKLALDKVSKSKKIVISGIYCPEEAKFIKTLGGKILYINSNSEIYSRIKNRNDSDRDNMSSQELDLAIERENSGKKPSETNTYKVQEYADFVIENSGTLYDLEIATKQLVNELGAK